MDLEEIFQRVALKCDVMLLEHYTSGKRVSPKVKLIVDTEDGITIKEITEVSKRIKNSIEMKQHFPMGFHLEVTSPGLRYPLKLAYQFRRNLNRSILIFHKDPGIPSPIEGVLKGVGEDQITLQNAEGDQNITFDVILEGKLILN